MLLTKIIRGRPQRIGWASAGSHSRNSPVHTGPALVFWVRPWYLGATGPPKAAIRAASRIA
jgi:hypothetical protein